MSWEVVLQRMNDYYKAHKKVAIAPHFVVIENIRRIPLS